MKYFEFENSENFMRKNSKNGIRMLFEVFEKKKIFTIKIKFFMKILKIPIFSVSFCPITQKHLGNIEFWNFHVKGLKKPIMTMIEIFEKIKICMQKNPMFHENLEIFRLFWRFLPHNLHSLVHFDIWNYHVKELKKCHRTHGWSFRKNGNLFAKNANFYDNLT